MTADASALPAGRPDRRGELLAAARRLLEAEGPEAIAIRRLGAAVGIRGPSVYKHVPDQAAAPLIAACGGDHSLARAAWAAIKGLVDLELADRFPPGTDLDATFAAADRAYSQTVARP